MRHMADEAEWFVARVERPLGPVLEWPVLEWPGVDQGDHGDYPFGDGGATAYVHGGQSVLTEPRAS
jgi:hypothetical protein